MSLYDRDNPDHEALRTRRMARWTPAKEAAFQAQMKAKEASMTLDEAMKAICEKHDLTSVSVHYHCGKPDRHPAFFSGNAHCEGVCMSGHGETAAEALGKALHQIEIKRAGPLPIPAIETEALA